MGVEDEAYKLNRQRIAQLLGDVAFYVECPVYFFMEAMGLAAYRDHIASMCAKPPGESRQEPASMQVALTVFVRHTRRMHAREPAMLEPLRAYVCKRLGYRPERLVVYYSEGGTRKDLTF